VKLEQEKDVRDGDRYELVGELASGGMATVYLARMRRPMGFSRLVAVKCMHPQYAKDPAFASMFVDEARLTAGLRHPNIVPTLDIVADDGHLLLVMEYVEGATVAGLLKANHQAKARIPASIAAAVVHDLCLGLHAAHEAQDDDGAPLSIIHRDVSPQNVIVGTDGHARVLDFGVAKAKNQVQHSLDNEIKGKIPYMPPEQLCGETLDCRVDVYAAGVVLWEMLVGKRLFEGPSETIIARKVLDDVIVPPSARIHGISSELDAIVMKALSREASDRFASALEMAEALEIAMDLASKNEVAAWVKALAPTAIKPLTTNPLHGIPAETLAKPAELPEHSDSLVPSSVDVPVEMTTIVAVLEKAATRHGDTPIQQFVRPLPKRRRLAGVLVAAACMIAGIAVSKAAITAKPAAAAQLAPANAPAPAPAPVNVDPVNEPKPIEESKTADVVKPVETTKIAKPIAVKPVAKAAAPIAAEPAPAANDTKSASCRPPYTVDADGHRHYKVECI
jgi:eukaryotic-like serine/threonine-protein kinase